MILHAALRRAVTGKSEAVREYLIHHAFSEPRRRAEVRQRRREAEAAALAAADAPDEAGAVRADPMRAVLRLDAEEVPQCLRRSRHGDARGIILPLARHVVLLPPGVAVNDEHGAAHTSAENAERKAHLAPRDGRPGREAAFLKAAVIGDGKAAGRGGAQQAHHVRRARLERVDGVRIDAIRADIRTAVRRDAVGHVHGKAAVVHQKAHKLRRDEGIPRRIKALSQPVEREAAAEAVLRRMIGAGGGLKVHPRQRGAGVGGKQRSKLRVAANGLPASGGVKRRLDIAAVMIFYRKRIVLRPMFLIAAAEIYFISGVVYSIHMYNFAYSCAEISKPKSACMALLTSARMTPSSFQQSSARRTASRSSHAS